ncbi:cache domain-containing protein, partial [Oleiphilus sp. HI0079]
MMTNIGLRSKILLSFVGLIFLSSLTTILAVILATNSSVEAQAKDKLIVGQNVFEQLLDIRSEQLFESAQVLTADFGFKTAVLTGDESTIVSVLANHGARIGADLMMLTSLDGQLIASTGSIVKLTHFPFQSLLSAAAEQGGLASTVVLQNKPYQILMLPVNAPITKAWALAGFEMDLSLASQLKELTSLEVGFIGSGEDGSGFELTTLALEDLGQYPSSDLAN